MGACNRGCPAGRDRERQVVHVLPAVEVGGRVDRAVVAQVEQRHGVDLELLRRLARNGRDEPTAQDSLRLYGESLRLELRDLRLCDEAILNRINDDIKKLRAHRARSFYFGEGARRSGCALVRS